MYTNMHNADELEELKQFRNGQSTKYCMWQYNSWISGKSNAK